MSERANANVAAKAIAQWHNARQDRYHVEEARIALEAIDPRLADLTPEDVTALFDYCLARHRFDVKTLTSTAGASMDAWHAIPAHAWEVLSR